MDRLAESVVRMQARLEEHGIESAVIGALAVAVWGEPRTTRDVDLKVLVEREQAERLVAALPPAFQGLGGQPLELLRTYGMLFGKDELDTRVDLLLAEIPFDREAILNSVEVQLHPNQSARVVTAEALVIYKIVAARPRDREDALSILRRQARLDLSYVRTWLRKFEGALDDATLLESLEDLLRQA